MVLHNERQTLPLNRTTTRSIVVIGSDAAEARLGGYSAEGAKGTSVLNGIREAVGKAAAVRYAMGAERLPREHVVVPAEFLSSTLDAKRVAGLQGEYGDTNRLDGTPKLVRTDARVDFGWTLNSPARGIPFDWYSVRWTGRVQVPSTGALPTRIGVEGNDGYRLYLDGKLIIDNWRKQSYGVRYAPIAVTRGWLHDIKLEFFESTGNARVKLVWDAGVARDWPRKIDSAVALARLSDVAVVVAGIEEGEFRDCSAVRRQRHHAVALD